MKIKFPLPLFHECHWMLIDDVRFPDMLSVGATIKKYMLFTGWEVGIGRNCARDLDSDSKNGKQTYQERKNIELTVHESKIAVLTA